MGAIESRERQPKLLFGSRGCLDRAGFAMEMAES